MTDIRIPRPNRPKQLISRHKHQRSTRNSYSKWLSVTIEERTFDAADYGNFRKQTGDPSWISADNLWGFLIDRNQTIETLGTEEQQFGFFPKTRNPTDEWHGYPVIPFQRGANKKYKISPELLQKWVDNGYLTEDQVAKLVKGRLL